MDMVPTIGKYSCHKESFILGLCSQPTIITVWGDPKVQVYINETKYLPGPIDLRLPLFPQEKGKLYNISVDMGKGTFPICFKSQPESTSPCLGFKEQDWLLWQPKTNYSHAVINLLSAMTFNFTQMNFSEQVPNSAPLHDSYKIHGWNPPTKHIYWTLCHAMK